jgi:transposase
MITKIPTSAQGKGNKKGKQSPPTKVLPLVNPNAAGIDIGSREHYVCVPADRDDQPVRSFSTFTPDLNALADWLIQCGIETVAMESTSIYWIPIFDLLEARGLQVYLVNARHLKCVPGRKSDVKDCQWIQQLHSFGLLQGSFRPEQEIRELRSYMRLRRSLTQDAARAILHMQKALSQMNIQLTQVVSDIAGKTGLNIIRDIVKGVHSPQELAQHRDKRCQNTKETIEKALEGHYQAEHLFALKIALETYDHYQQTIDHCDQEIAKVLDAFSKRHPLQTPSQAPTVGLKKNKKAPRVNIADLDQHLVILCGGGHLAQVDGLSSSILLELISEIGTDMSKWPTKKHFGSWLGLAPGTKISGGKVLSSRTKPSNNRAAALFRLAANSLHSSQSALGGFLRRQKARIGAPKAITATGYKLARIVYSLLESKKTYQDLGEPAYLERYQKQQIHYLAKKAKALGMELIPAASAVSAI